MKKKLKYYIKEISGGQDLTPRQRAIFMWWALSLTAAMLFAECLPLCALVVASFAWSSHYLKEVPIPEDDSREI